MIEVFNRSTKLIFKDESETGYIKFGTMGCNDAKVKIRRGQLTLSGYVSPPSPCIVPVVAMYVADTPNSQLRYGQVLQTVP